jgi:curved DNA-binding protein CbpA
MPTLYDILGVAPQATEREIIAAYRRLAREYHPDMNIALPPGQRVDVEERFKEIANAQEILTNPEKKAAYDAGLFCGSRLDPHSPTGQKKKEAFKEGRGKRAGWGKRGWSPEPTWRAGWGPGGWDNTTMPDESPVAAEQEAASKKDGSKDNLLLEELTPSLPEEMGFTKIESLIPDDVHVSWDMNLRLSKRFEVHSYTQRRGERARIFQDAKYRKLSHTMLGMTLKKGICVS